jgi:monocyte-to-macrophage differentiation protein
LKFQTDPAGVHELAIGGVIYVCGVIFFKLDGVVPFAHAIWHVFVGLGALAHFYAINKYLVGIHGPKESIIDIDQLTI